MKRKLMIVVFALLILASGLMAGCTQNDRAKNWGGTMKIDLPTGQKLVNATWKEADLWYLTRPAKQGETPETLTFKEESSLGIMSGTVIFQEH